MRLEPMLSWVRVADYGRAKEFYGEVLGLKQVFEMEGWAEFRYAGSAATVGLSAPLPDWGQAEAAPGATIVFEVDDLDAARGELARRGVEFEGEVHEVPGVVRIASFRDPFGNPLQLAQPLAGRSAAAARESRS